MRRKLVLSFLIVVIVGISITALYSMKLSQDSYTSSLEDKLKSDSMLISQIFLKEYSADSISYDAFAVYYSSITNSRVTIIARDGKVLGESTKDSATLENHAGRPEFLEAISGGVGKSYRYSSTEGYNMLYVAVPVKNDNGIFAVIRLSVPLTEIQKIETHYLNYIAIAGIAGVLFCLLLSLLFMRGITKPVTEMTHISSQIAGGRYDKRIRLKSSDEIGELARSFNNMAEKLEITISDLNDKNNKLEAILKSMQSGVIAVDGVGKVMLVNPAALSMFGYSGNIIGRHILEVFRNIELEEIITSYQDEIREINLNYPEKRVIRVKAAPIQDISGNNKNIGKVVVMQDITELKQLEQIRSEFVANVSHELKTPLTSIKGFAETLKGGAIDDNATKDKFLDIINIEADRLTRLINDILSLSELENKRQNIVFEKINIYDSISEIEDMMGSLAKLKEIKLTFEMQDVDLYVMGNHDKMKQLMINLIDNAIKYTPKGGSVTVKAYSKEGCAYIEVSDTGIGIAKENLPRLFERFYRVDKGRSRALGGTGLGLAIVKHIAAAMEGRISVESEIGKGSKFTVIFPEFKA